MKRRQFSAQLATAATAAITLPWLGRATAQTAPVEGQAYLKLSPPVPTTVVPGKVDVIEFFSYACPHCFHFEPTLEGWTKRLPAEVNFHRVPVPFLFNAENFQRTYYTLEAMNLVDALQLKVFNAVHVDKQPVSSPQELAELMKKNGVDPAKFLDTFNSFSVQTKVRQAKQLVDSYRLQSVPMMAVQGRYTTSPSQANGPEQALRVVDYLVAQVRAGR